MKIRVLYFFSFLLAVFFSSCKEDVRGSLFVSDEIPAPVSNIKIENQPGGAIIHYTIPNDPNIAYIEAKYAKKNGKVISHVASIFQNYALIEGIADDTEVIVELCTINKFDNRSEVVSVQINPLPPYINSLINSAFYDTTFGGIYYSFTNDVEKEYVIHTIVQDENGEWLDYDRHYSNRGSIENSVRGFESSPYTFGIFAEDEWHNISDTVVFELTPLYEEFFDKNLWNQYNLADDTNTPRYGPLSGLWSDKDGVLTNSTYFFMPLNDPNIVLPNWFTIDLGKEYKFGRLKVNNINHGAYWRYAQGTPKTFEIWATNSPSIDWDDWTLLGEFECIKPSGAPSGIIEDIDLAQLMAGDEYDFPFQEENAYYRYVRFKTLSTFGDVPDVCLLELTFWGESKQ